MTRFEDRIALITGGTSGIGLATAQRLRAEGAEVIITARNQVRLQDVVENLGTRVFGIPGDITNRGDLETLSATIRDRYGRLDVLFANAGIGAFQSIGDVTDAEFYRVVDANIKGAFFTIQQALPLLSDRGSIVINASFGMHRGVPGAALYSATKAAVHNLARTLAAELAPRRIRVNSVSPGFIDTPAFRAELSAEARAAVVTGIAAGRVGNPDEVAAAVAFLASDEAAYINGQDLLIDGGLISAAPAPML